MPSPSICTSYRFSPTIENRENREELLARYNNSYHEEELKEKVQVENEKVKVEEKEETGKWNNGYDGQLHSNITEIQEATIDEKILTLSKNSPTEEVLLGKEECDIAGTQKERKSQKEESEARRRWRGACKLALHTNPGALHTNPNAAKKLSLPEIRYDSGKQKS